MTLTTEQINLLNRLQGSKPVSAIAREANLARSTVRGYYERKARMNSAAAAPAPTSAKLAVPVRPLAVPMPPKVEVSGHRGDTITGLLYGDSHFPFQDDRVLSIVGQIAEHLQPDTIVHMGDLLDCYALSAYDKDPARVDSLQDEIDQGRVHLAQMRLRAPDAAFILLEGNHEDRLRRTVWNLPGQAAALAKLRVFQQAMTWPTLLGLDELGITFVPYDSRQAKFKVFPKWILKHGTLVRKHSAYTARGEWEKYGRSGSSGHTHRLGAYFHSDHNGSHCWVETGCTCTLEPEYTPDPNWQAGCVVVTFEKTTGAFQAEPVYIHNGLAVWRGRVYRA